MDVQKYLNRIGFKGETEVSLACLTKLQNCHQRSVPFENLDIFTERKKVLSYEILYEQIVTKKRGGWCHELNGLFSWLLNQLGFNVQLISAQYFDQDKQEFCKVFDHMVIIIQLEDQKYLSDVGLGNIREPLDPIRITQEIIQSQVCADYKVSRSEGWWLLAYKDRDVVGHHREDMNKVVSDETWITMFKFDEVPRSLEDFQERCNEYQSKESGLLLSNKPMAIIKSADGGSVNCLIGTRFTSVSYQNNLDTRSNRLNLSSTEYNRILFETFGITFPDQTFDINKIEEEKED